MGAKLDFVREDVPNVRSLTFLSVICPLLLEVSTNHPLRLHSFASSSLFWTATFFLRQVSPLFLLPLLRFRFPRRRSTTSRCFPMFRGTMHISPIFMEFLVDFFSSPVPPLFSFSISITNVFYSVFQSFTFSFSHFWFCFSYFFIDLFNS